MSIKNLKIRFNLDKEMTARRMSICNAQTIRTAKRSFLLSANIWSYPKGRQPKMLSLKESLQPLKRNWQKPILSAVCYNLCRHRLHKYPPKKKIKPKRKKPLWILWTTFKVTNISAFDGTVMAFLKEIATTPYKGSIISKN